jgi:hypothetical protein
LFGRERLEILMIFQSQKLQKSYTIMAVAKASLSCGRKARMSAIGKAAGLFLAATSSVLGMAQGSQAAPAQKPSPAISTSAPATQPRIQAFPNAAQSANRQSVTAPATPEVQPPSASPQPIQPTVAVPVAAPNIQFSAAQPVAMNALSPNGSAAVDYARGQLTVVSERATLGQVLKLVTAKTGGVVDVSPELQNELVMARLGPGPVREVLTELLDSPKVDYIIMGTGDGPNSLERIVVRTRAAFGRTALAAVPRTQPRPQPEEEAKLDENGRLANGLTPAEAKLTQEQLMENWKKTREEMRLAEIQQQAQDRENEKSPPQVEPQPEQPTGPPPPPDNPPQI